eukprot:gnl/TRDRNA2_/TRDRNA2_91840_c0_seq2.p1 gnl/TRDRNA2_/TRDRNA2_91840_c0~~gnl/TRDRNA2_/TRDRNA2_91840_c0_seq2.p1  ORF type:complete len:311 (+),score=39.24 gnl/TRDRNA2_/TRDRNA2_91840_c0_seq2:54-935(+)
MPGNGSAPERPPLANLNGSICNLRGADSNAAPVFCSSHSTSEQRSKKEAEMRECRKCGQRLQTNYAQFALCPACSAGDGRCMICASAVPVDGRKEPLPAPPPPAGATPLPAPPPLATQQDREMMMTAKAARTVSRSAEVPPPPKPPERMSWDLNGAPPQNLRPNSNSGPAYGLSSTVGNGVGSPQQQKFAGWGQQAASSAMSSGGPRRSASAVAFGANGGSSSGGLLGFLNIFERACSNVTPDYSRQYTYENTPYSQNYPVSPMNTAGPGQPGSLFSNAAPALNGNSGGLRMM